MTASTARIVPFQRTVAHRSAEFPSAYVLRVRGAPTHRPKVDVVNPGSGAPLSTWQGEVAWHLLAAPAIRAIVAGDGDYPCTQACLHRVVLAAAAVEASLEQLAARRDAALSGAAGHAAVQAGFGPERLERRLARLGVCLDGDERLIARLLFEHPGEHFTVRDVSCLVGLVAPVCKGVDAASTLDALVDRAVVQRIDLLDGPSFYDIDTRPHAHRYDAATGQLHDVDGVPAG